MVISAFVMFRNTEIDMYKILVFLKELFKMRKLLETWGQQPFPIKVIMHNPWFDKMNLRHSN